MGKHTRHRKGVKAPAGCNSSNSEFALVGKTECSDDGISLSEKESQTPSCSVSNTKGQITINEEFDLPCQLSDTKKGRKCLNSDSSPCTLAAAPCVQDESDFHRMTCNLGADKNSREDLAAENSQLLTMLRLPNSQPCEPKSPLSSKSTTMSKTHYSLTPGNSYAPIKQPISKTEKCFSKSRDSSEHCKGIALGWQWWLILIFFTGCSILTRLYKIEEPAHVCWDETHFGKMGSWYINRTFFFDVHPPLGKMLIGLSGYLKGYNGSFAFDKPGSEYGDTFYVPMRMFCALLGICIVPLSYCITWELTQSITAAVLSTVLVLCDTGILTLSQYILLDPILLFFITAATYSCLKFKSKCHQAFCGRWWLWLTLTGILLACSIGVKFVGLFVILLAGYSTVKDLWDILGDLTKPMSLVMKHLLARVLCLIVLPLSSYMLFFYIHFAVLSKSGGGDGFFSSAFQSRLEGNPLYKASMPKNIAYGSVVTMKNHRTAGGYLHSHWHLYPEGLGARQQQVTTYSHKDENNKWMIKKYNKDPKPDDKLDLVSHGDFIRLEHVATKRNLHSHHEGAPLSRRHYQVSCYGENGFGDSNDIFRLEINGGNDKELVTTVRTVFRLVHMNVGCAVHSHNKQLPKWGWDQMEVTCNPNIRDKNNLWNIEEVVDERLPNTSFEVYAPSFLEKFIESHAVMAQGNSGLKPKEGEVTSRPWQWPLNYKGQYFSGGDYRVYLLGNPVIWWSNIALMIWFMLAIIVYSFAIQRGCQFEKKTKEEHSKVFNACSWLLLAWALHYLPFWGMSRVLYYHHYFPAFIYNCLLSGIMLDYSVKLFSSIFPSSLSWVITHFIYGTLISVFVYSFYLFSPLSYGMHGPHANEESSMMRGLKWLDSWDF